MNLSSYLNILSLRFLHKEEVKFDIQGVFSQKITVAYEFGLVFAEGIWNIHI